MTRSLMNWRSFWILWVGGLVIIITLVSQNDQLVTQLVPRGMVDHQAASTADRVDEIHRSWADHGRMRFARIAMIFDLLFIVIYSIGGMIGGILIRKQAHSAILTGLGGVVLVAYAAFGILDFIETACQAIQLFATGGNDALARTASTVRLPKLAAFAVGFPLILISLVWLWFEKRR